MVLSKDTIFDSLSASSFYHIKYFSNDLVKSDEEVVPQWRQSWVFSLGWKFLKKPPSSHIFRDFVFISWKVSSPRLVLDAANDFFLFCVKSKSDAISILTSGPWSFKCYFLPVFLWRVNF